VDDDAEGEENYGEGDNEEDEAAEGLQGQWSNVAEDEVAADRNSTVADKRLHRWSKSSGAIPPRKRRVRTRTRLDAAIERERGDARFTTLNLFFLGLPEPVPCNTSLPRPWRPARALLRSTRAIRTLSTTLRTTFTASASPPVRVTWPSPSLTGTPPRYAAVAGRGFVPKE